MSRARQHILVIEDNPQLGRFITVALQAAGWTTLGPIGDYAAALEATQAAPFDLALVDLALSGKDCTPIADAVMARSIPCLLMSGYSQSRLPERLRSLPFVAKPFTLECLVDAARSALEGGTAAAAPPR